MKKFTCLVVSGGSFGGISAIGVIKCLEEYQDMSNIYTYVGTSAGAIICAAAALGFSSSEMMEFFLAQMKNPRLTTFNTIELLNVLNSYGLSSGSNLDMFIDELFRFKKLASNITFLEFAKVTGKNLVVCVSNVSKCKLEFWDVDNTPSISVKMAIRTTCSIPILFNPVMYKGDWYVDGGIYNNFPLNYFNTVQSPLQDILAIRMVNKDKMAKELSSFFSFVGRIISSMIENTVDMHVMLSSKKDNILELNIACESLMDLTTCDNNLKILLSKEKVSQMFNGGYEAAKKTFQEAFD